MMSGEAFHGNWKIIECINISGSRNPPPTKIEGAIFTLQENGEIRWELGSEVDHSFPLFQCDCYEVVYPFVGASIQMGAVSGHMFEFWVDRPVPRDMMLLTFEGWCMIQCQQTVPLHPPLDFPFSFHPALIDGYFSDLEVIGGKESSGSHVYSGGEKEFKIHSVIMELSDGKPDELKGLPNDVLETALHFLYSQSLPSNLLRETATRCIQFAPPSMSTDFVHMCREYLHRTALKQKIMKLVNEVHTCAEQMTQSFQENSVTNPCRFCIVVKVALQHAAVAFMKLVELCVLYGEEAHRLQRNERLEILRYAKTRLPILLTQFVALLRNVKSDFSTVKPAERNDIAAHVAPEIEILLEFLSHMMKEARDACNDIWIRWSTQFANGTQPTATAGTQCPGLGCWQDDSTGTPSFYCSIPNSSAAAGGGANPTSATPANSNEESLTEVLYGIFRKREVMKLHGVQGQVAQIYLYLAQKKENFEEMTDAVKIRCVARNLEQLLEELPVFLLRLEEIMIAFDDRFQWKDFKFCLQLAISQVCQTVHHLRMERRRLQRFFTILSDLVQRDEFHQSLVNLKLLEVNQTGGTAEPGAEKCGCGPESGPDVNQESNTTGLQSNEPSLPRKTKIDVSEKDLSEMDELNVVDNICTPKPSKQSVLALNASKLYNSSQFSDMVFEIVQDADKLEIPSHRVIVASRCDWFRRALLSGMKESIQKRIVIHDSSVMVFQLFLKYIYTGQITDSENKTLETFTDLIALADKYEMDSLKLTCEQELVMRHLDENSVIFLLSMADQYNARTLRGACMEYIALNPDVMGRELFEELTPELQMEVYDVTMWSKPNRKVFSTQDELLNCPRYMLVPESPSSSSSSASSPQSSPTLAHRHRCEAGDEGEEAPMVRRSTGGHRTHHHHHRHRHHHLHRHQHGENPAADAPMPDPVANDLSAELERCISQLRGILGEESNVEHLRRIALAADFDLNRALNFFFSS